MKGVGRIYQQTFIDTYAKVAFAKLYDRKTPITAADMLNDRVVPFFDSQEVKLLRVLTDRGSEYCGNPEHQGQEPTDQRHLRTLPQDRAERILPRRIPQKGVPFNRRAAGRLGSMDPRVQ